MKLKKEDTERVYQMAEELVGSCQSGRFRRDILVSNIERRLMLLQCKSLDQYLERARNDQTEWKRMISALTIHTTSWFREMPHFELLKDVLVAFVAQNEKRPFRVWSAACSTGEEVYSAALVLEYFKMTHPGFEYEVHGSDIDPVSVEIAKKAIYQSKTVLPSVPLEFHRGVMVGSGRTVGYLTLSPEIRKVCKFKTDSLDQLSQKPVMDKYDWIFCRNVLIYFSEDKVATIIRSLKERLNFDGILCLGHSEAQTRAPEGLTLIGPSSYQFRDPKRNLTLIAGEAQKKSQPKSKVLVIDDSSVVRVSLKKLLVKAGYEVWEAESAAIADEMIAKNDYDLISLDLRMPEEDGSSWLKRFRKTGNKTNVMILSDSDPKDAEIVFGALESGAQDYIMKSYLSNNKDQFLERVKALARSRKEPRVVSSVKKRSVMDLQKINPEVILIGASTGGPETLCQILKGIGNPDCLPIVVVQHINHSFAKPFALRLASISGLMIHEPRNGEILKNGQIYLAFDHYHIGLTRTDKGLAIKISQDELMHGHRPAVDFLFQSAANAKARTVAFLMTGMGRDGAQGMVDLFNTGLSHNITQNEESSVVYGMPKEAVMRGASHHSGGIEEIHDWVKKVAQFKTKN
jgi:chemotaxis response regulator CheB/chemotaxis methyl-accepting protein methylase